MCKGLSSLPFSCLERAKGMRVKLTHLAERQDWTHHKHKAQDNQIIHDLDSLLSSKTGLQAFRWFLCSEFSNENLEFWLACEDYRVSPSHLLRAKASSIYSKFVSSNSSHEVNLDAETREALLGVIDSPSVDTFKDAQQRIYSLMASDSFPRFLRSPHFMEVIKA